jgi:FkbM family methyltransferase
MMAKLLQRAISAVPWAMRRAIKHVPLVAPLQRWIVANFLREEFVHRVDAGPARGLLYPVRLPQDKGVWTGTYETDFATALANAVTPGAVCFDIGGWHGFYSGVMALAGASKVVVFEPLPANCARIRRVIGLNPELPIELIEAAVADRPGRTEFQVMGQESMGKLAESPFQPGQTSTHQISVELVSLDDLLAQNRIAAPALMKIDVEGGELLVLRGAAELLRTFHPVLFIELHSPQLARDCRSFLETLGYEIELLKEEGPVDPEICHFRAGPPGRPALRRNRAGESKESESFDIPILLYHHLVDSTQVDPEVYEISIQQFEQQLDLLQKLRFNVITFATLLRIMRGAEPRPERLAIITFDDAFRSFYELAFPALRHRAMPATVFVPAGEIGGSNRWDSSTGFPERRIMTEDELREIAADGMEIGSHGWVHRSLPKCSEEEADEELARSREHLAGLGMRPDVFAYPYGEHSRRSMAKVRAAGYEAAVSIFSDAPSVTANRFAMRRVYVHAGDSPLRFRCKLSRLYLRYKAMRGLPGDGDPVGA